MRRALPLVAALAFLPRDGAAGLPKEVGQRTMPAVAYLLAADLDDGQLKPVSSGSGTILTPDGAVLTNRHVVWDLEHDRPHDVVAIGLLKAYDQAPELTCLAVPTHGLIEPDLDLAVLKCEVDLSGKPYKASHWPTVPVGTSRDLMPGSSDVYVMGYPGVGGATIHVTRGLVSGFIGKDGGTGRFWIKTDAAIAHGNSGGTAIDEAGALVGIPTAVYPGQNKDEGERVGLLRPVELARPLIDRALAGWTPSKDASATPAPKPDRATGAPEATCATGGATVIGKVVSSDNHAPIEGAFFIVLKPGSSRGDVADDFSDIDDAALTFGISNQDGEFATRCPVPKNRRYTVIVLAKGFRELSKDGVLDTTNVPDRFAPWGGVVKLQRL